MDLYCFTHQICGNILKKCYVTILLHSFLSRKHLFLIIKENVSCRYAYNLVLADSKYSLPSFWELLTWMCITFCQIIFFPTEMIMWIFINLVNYIDFQLNWLHFRIKFTCPWYYLFDTVCNFLSIFIIMSASLFMFDLGLLFTFFQISLSNVCLSNFGLIQSVSVHSFSFTFWERYVTLALFHSPMFVRIHGWNH